MGEKLSTNQLASGYDVLPGSMTYTIQHINDKMVRGVADKLHVPLYQALQLWADYCDEAPDDMYMQLTENLRNVIKQEVISEKHHK